MITKLALAMSLIALFWLFARDRNLRPMTSWALWIPLLWLMIIGSRAVTYWLGTEIAVDMPDSYLEGNPLDRNIFLALMLAGAVVLLRRHINWGKVFESNRWLFIFFLYCGASIIWSDYPFVSFKRWAKDLGNVIMVLIILTEYDPLQAIKAIFARYSYFAIIISVLLITCFPDSGVLFDRWTQEPMYIGVSTHKNHLGIALTVCGLFLIWNLLEARAVNGMKVDKVDVLVRFILLAMLVWLLKMAGSATALVCLTLGAGILIFMRFPLGQRQVRHLGVYSFAAFITLLSLYSFPSIMKGFVKFLGRDMTFTGRTEIWSGLLRERIDPFFGTGYMSFWLGSAVERYDNITQAHNGYLETYLNGGLIGLCLLAAMIVFTGSKLKKELLQGSSLGILLFCFLSIAVFYNLTEAMFNKLSLVWFVLLIAALNYPPGKAAGRLPPQESCQSR